MATLLLHKGVTFEDQTVYLSGNAYVECNFARCTFVLRDAPFHIEGGKAEGCVWHLDLVVHDPAQLTALITFLQSSVAGSIPNAPENQNSPTASPQT